MSPLERAFELAGSGKYLTVDGLKRTLSREGYSTHQVYGTGAIGLDGDPRIGHLSMVLL
jgi:hypothetical protein